MAPAITPAQRLARSRVMTTVAEAHPTQLTLREIVQPGEHEPELVRELMHTVSELIARGTLVKVWHEARSGKQGSAQIQAHYTYGLPAKDAA